MIIEAIKLYESGKSLREVGKEFGVSKDRIRYMFKKLLIPLRTRSESNSGKKRSLETKQKLSAAAMGGKKSLETCKKMSESRMGKKASPETKQKMSEVQRGENYDSVEAVKQANRKTARKLIPVADKCEFCGKINTADISFHRHHIDEDTHNNDVATNLVVLCNSCHRLEHARLNKEKKKKREEK